MCTNTCPCLNGHVEVFDKLKLHHKWLFALDEEKLNKYNRTNIKPVRKGLKPLIWTDDKTKGYNNFMDCYKFWEKKSLSNGIKKFSDVKFSEGDLSFINIWQNNPNNMEMTYLIQHMDEAQIYHYFEDTFECSGIC